MILTNTATAKYQSMGQPGSIQATSDFTVTSAPVIFTKVQTPTADPSTGISLGAIPQNGSKTVTFQGVVQ